MRSENIEARGRKSEERDFVPAYRRPLLTCRHEPLPASTCVLSAFHCVVWCVETHKARPASASSNSDPMCHTPRDTLRHSMRTRSSPTRPPRGSTRGPRRAGGPIAPCGSTLTCPADASSAGRPWAWSRMHTSLEARGVRACDLHSISVIHTPHTRRVSERARRGPVTQPRDRTARARVSCSMAPADRTRDGAARLRGLS